MKSRTSCFVRETKPPSKASSNIGCSFRRAKSHIDLTSLTPMSLASAQIANTLPRSVSQYSRAQPHSSFSRSVSLIRKAASWLKAASWFSSHPSGST